MSHEQQIKDMRAVDRPARPAQEIYADGVDHGSRAMRVKCEHLVKSWQWNRPKEQLLRAIRKLK